MALSQLTAPCIRNVVASILAAKDSGFEMTPDFFDKHIAIRQSILFRRSSLRKRRYLGKGSRCRGWKCSNNRGDLSLESWSLESQEHLGDSSDEDDDREMVDATDLPSIFGDENDIASVGADHPAAAANLEVVTTSAPHRTSRARDVTESDPDNPPHVKRVRVERLVVEADNQAEVRREIAVEDRVASEEGRVDEDDAAEGGQVANDDEGVGSEIEQVFTEGSNDEQLVQNAA
ncbi:unnamed protein product [Cochlearia groenlandica]